MYYSFIHYLNNVIRMELDFKYSVVGTVKDKVNGN